MMITTIHNALLVTLIDSGISLDGTNILDLMARAEDNVLDANMSAWGGNRDADGNITYRGRRAILHAERDTEYVDSLLATAAAQHGGNLFA